MVFGGDVAIAVGDQFGFRGFCRSLLSKPWCLNLEGSVVNGGVALPQWGVYNSAGWWSSFEEFNLGPVFIGNNHIHDVDGGVKLTLDALARRGLTGFGAGCTSVEAAQGVSASSGDRDYRLLGFGWPVIGCVSADVARPGVNRLEGGRALELAEGALEESGAARVVVVIHGNYEFERYPQPAHRKLARILIDRGVYAVIFHHPHIVGPLERYKGRTIAYSLGNWAFSHGRFFQGRLKFPESSFHQIAVELADDGDLVHHARFEPPRTVKYHGCERVDSQTFSLKPVFEGYDDEEYFQWFRENRLKRRLLPIYGEPGDTIANQMRDKWVGVRQMLIDSAAKSGLKTMRREAA